MLFWLICLPFLAGCPEKPTRQPVERPLLERIALQDFPGHSDDEPTETLRSAANASLAYYDRIPGDKTFPLGDRAVSAKILRDSLARFLELLDSHRLTPESLFEEFDIVRVRPPDASMLITGYYEPVLEGSLKRESGFQWPLYSVPSDLLTIDLNAFDPDRFHGERLVGRMEGKRIVPYYTRSEIDGGRKLERSGAQIAWLKDPIACFFLHVQGSGMIRLPDGRTRRVGYAGSNGRRYRSIGRGLMEKGIISREEMSLQAIRDHLLSHPESRDELMWENESYVFFRFVREGPRGSLDIVLTAGRSIASDPRFHPRGALAFLVSEKPRRGVSGEVAGWAPFGRWVLNQDVGGAIKGPGRIDLFCGTGEEAERTAGPMKQPGQLYYFIKKGLLPQD